MVEAPLDPGRFKKPRLSSSRHPTSACVRGGEVARWGIWENELLEMYYQKPLHRVRPYEGVAAEWLALVLEYLASTSSLGDFASGSTIDHLPQEDLRSIPVVLPPLAGLNLVTPAVPASVP